jgi:uncharacterized protein YbjT (DUF2867 family)
MKIVVIGGTGLIGKKVVSNLRQHGHEVLAASPSSGVNTVTGEGVAQALAGARVVVDVANAPFWEDKAVLEFFETSGRNLLTAEGAARVGHHWHCRSLAPIACLRVVTSAQRWPKKS